MKKNITHNPAEKTQKKKAKTETPETPKEKSTEETFVDKVVKSLMFIIPMIILYTCYYKFGPEIALEKFPKLSPPVAGLLAAFLFMPLVGLLWYIVSHLWPTHDMQKSMWIFVFILVVVFSADYYFYRQAHPELYGPSSTIAQAKNQTANSKPRSSGKILIINLQPNEEYEIDDLKKGQKWRYESFNGEFWQRINTGDGKACWKLMDRNIIWKADVAGTLEVRAGGKAVQIKTKIL